MAKDERTRYRERQTADDDGKGLKVIGFKPAPDLDRRLREMAAMQGVSISKVVDTVLRDGFEGRAGAGVAERAAARLEAAVERIEHIAETAVHASTSVATWPNLEMEITLLAAVIEALPHSTTQSAAGWLDALAWGVMSVPVHQNLWFHLSMLRLDLQRNPHMRLDIVLQPRTIAFFGHQPPPHDAVENVLDLTSRIQRNAAGDLEVDANVLRYVTRLQALGPKALAHADAAAAALVAAFSRTPGDTSNRPDSDSIEAALARVEQRFGVPRAKRAKG